MDQHQVAFVSEQREQGRLAVGFTFHFRQQFRGFGSDLATVVLGKRAPGGPAETHHLVKHSVALDRQGHGGELPGGNRESRGMGWIHGLIVLNH